MSEWMPHIISKETRADNLSGDEAGDSLANRLVVVDRQNPDQFGDAARGFPLIPAAEKRPVSHEYRALGAVP
jgi:hypothetical protein